MTKPWTAHKTLIHDLYITRNLTLKEVRKMLKEEQGFNASVRAYKNMLDRWQYIKRKKQATTFSAGSRQVSVSDDFSDADLMDIVDEPQTPQSHGVEANDTEYPLNSPSHRASGDESSSRADTPSLTASSSNYRSNQEARSSWKVFRRALAAAVDVVLRDNTQPNAQPAPWVGRILTSTEGVDAWVPGEPRGLSPIHLAITHRSTSMVDFLLDAGADANVRDREGNTPLHIALRYPAWDSGSGLVQRLLQFGADINSRSSNGYTPLHVAVQHYASTSTLRILLAAGASVTARDDQGYTPLDFAVTSRASDLELRHLRLDSREVQQRASSTVKLLLENMADPNTRTAYGLSPLHTAIRCGAPDDTVRYLLEAKADVNARDTRGLAPLCIAIRSQASRTTVQLLIEAGADIHTPNDAGETPLHRAVQQGPLWTVELLVEAGARVNEATPNGNTPLHLASRVKNLQHAEMIVTALLAAGATVDARNNQGRTPLGELIIAGIDHGLTGGHAVGYMDHFNSIVQRLLDAGADPACYHAAMTIRC